MTLPWRHRRGASSISAAGAWPAMAITWHCSHSAAAMPPCGAAKERQSMLPPADEAIVARDSELPGLRLALDPQALGAMQTLPPMRSLHLRYKPGTNCVASLAPAASDGLAAVAVMAYPPARYAEVRARREWHAAPNPVIFHDEYCLAIVPLALDRKLKGAQRIADPQRGKAFLHSLTGNESAATNLR